MRHVFFVLALLCDGAERGHLLFLLDHRHAGPRSRRRGVGVNSMHGMNTIVRSPIFAIVFFGALILPLAAALGSRSAGHRGAARSRASRR